MLAPAAAQFWAGAGAGGGGGSPPSGPPTSPYVEYQSGTNKIRLVWTNGDASAYTQIGHVANGGPTPNVDPTFVLLQIDPGNSAFDTHFTADAINYLRDGTILTDWYVRHYSGGTATAWVYAGNTKGGTAQAPE